MLLNFCKFHSNVVTPTKASRRTDKPDQVKGQEVISKDKVKGKEEESTRIIHMLKRDIESREDVIRKQRTQINDQKKEIYREEEKA